MKTGNMVTAIRAIVACCVLSGKRKRAGRQNQELEPSPSGSRQHFQEDFHQPKQDQAKGILNPFSHHQFGLAVKLEREIVY